jgi:hypothetical protein
MRLEPICDFHEVDHHSGADGTGGFRVVDQQFDRAPGHVAVDSTTATRQANDPFDGGIRAKRGHESTLEVGVDGTERVTRSVCIATDGETMRARARVEDESMLGSGKSSRGMWLFSLGFAAIGCGGGTYADIKGSVEGIKINANAFFFGGPFIVFTDHESECLDVSWVKRGSSFASGAEPPTDYNQNVLLFTYSEDAVVAENISVAGESLVTAHVLSVQGGNLAVYDAVDGFIDVTEITKKDHAVGEFDLTFENGALSGSFEVESCNNLKADR